jgi:hypothetical protein
MVMPTGVAVIAVIDRPAGVALFDGGQKLHFCGSHIGDGAAFWPAVLWAGDQPVVAQLLAFSQMCIVGGRGDRPDSDDAGVRCHLRRPVRGVGDPEQGDVVVLAVVAFIGLVGEPPNSLETSGLVEVVDAATIVAVSAVSRLCWPLLSWTSHQAVQVSVGLPSAL